MSKNAHKIIVSETVPSWYRERWVNLILSIISHSSIWKFDREHITDFLAFDLIATSDQYGSSCFKKRDVSVASPVGKSNRSESIANIASTVATCQCYILLSFRTSRHSFVANVSYDLTGTLWLTRILTADHSTLQCKISEMISKVNGANMGPTWGRQDPGETHVGLMKLHLGVEAVLSHIHTVLS